MSPHNPLESVILLSKEFVKSGNGFRPRSLKSPAHLAEVGVDLVHHMVVGSFFGMTDLLNKTTPFVNQNQPPTVILGESLQSWASVRYSCGSRNPREFREASGTDELQNCWT